MAEWFLNSKKGKRSLKIMRFVKISDIKRGGRGKKLRRFRTICHIRCLQTKISQKKNHSVEKNLVRFGVSDDRIVV